MRASISRSPTPFYDIIALPKPPPHTLIELISAMLKTPSRSKEIKAVPNLRLNAQRLFLLLASLESIGVIIALTWIRSGPNTAWLFGYSLSRWLMILVAVGFNYIFVSALLHSFRKLDRFNRVVDKVESLIHLPGVLWMSTLILLGGIFLGFYILYTPISSHLGAISSRLTPVLVIILILFGLQTIIFTNYLYFVTTSRKPSTNNRRVSMLRYSTYFFLVSLVIRLLFAFPVIANNVAPKYDEIGYYARAQGFEIVLDDLVGDTPPKIKDASAYGGGKWPPLHSFILGLSLFFGESNWATARVTVVVLSALTTPLVYLITTKSFNAKGGIYAALIHIFYPSFIAYSHYLWSETTYIFFLLLAFYSIILVVDSQRGKKKLAFAILAGIFLGLSGLTRTASLPFLIIMPLWLFMALKKTKHRATYPLIVFSTCIIVWLPWLVLLQQKEGRFMPLATTGGYNLYLGNNPFDSNKRSLVLQSIGEYAEINSIHPDLAARTLAFEEIQGDIGGFFVNSLSRLSRLWAVDSFLMRHTLSLVYPPLEPDAILWIWAYVIISYFLLLLLAMWGLISTSFKNQPLRLIIILVVSGMVLPAISVSITRMHIPLLALLLPAAGIGVANIKIEASRAKKYFILMIGLILSFKIISTIPNVMSFTNPSSYYINPVNKIDDIVGSNTTFADTIKIRILNDEAYTIRINIISEGYLFENNNSREFIWDFPSEKNTLSLIIVSNEVSIPLELEISSESLNQSVIIYPIDGDHWKQWQPVGIDQVIYVWLGG